TRPPAGQAWIPAARSGSNAVPEGSSGPGSGMYQRSACLAARGEVERAEEGGGPVAQESRRGRDAGVVQDVVLRAKSGGPGVQPGRVERGEVPPAGVEAADQDLDRPDRLRRPGCAVA